METSTLTPLNENTNNSKSCEDTQAVIIRSTIFRKYWVKFQNEKIEIGRQGESSPLLSFMDRSYTKEKEESRELVAKEIISDSRKCKTKVAEWKTISDGIVPDDAFFAGSDPKCALFVGRAYHEGDLLPGKVCLASKVCYVPWRGEEYEKREYEVLTGDNYKWVPYLTKGILVDAVPGGMTVDGTTLYIGRTTYNNTLTPGKVYPYTGLLYIPVSGLERTFSNYEILMFK